MSGQIQPAAGQSAQLNADPVLVVTPTTSQLPRLTAGNNPVTFQATLTGGSSASGPVWYTGGVGGFVNQPNNQWIISYSPTQAGSASLFATVTVNGKLLTSNTVTISVVPPTGVTVIGTVVDIHGQPFPGIAIAINGVDIGTPTGADGTFTSPATVTPPYSVTAMLGATATAPRFVVTYEGLTIAKPTIVLGYPLGCPSSGALPSAATCKGGGNFADPVAVTPGAPFVTASPLAASAVAIAGVGGALPGFPTPLGTAPKVTAVTFGSPNTPGRGAPYALGAITDSADSLESIIFPTTTPPYDLVPVLWYGTAGTTGTVHVLEWPTLGGLPAAAGFPPAVEYYYGESAANLTPTGIEVASVQGLQVAQLGIDGTIYAPPIASSGFSIAAENMWLDFADGSFIQMVTGFLPGPLLNQTDEFSFLTPQVNGGTMSVEARGLDPAFGFTSSITSGLAPDATGVPIYLETPPVAVVTPANVTCGSQFQWVPFANGVNMAVFLAFSEAAGAGSGGFVAGSLGPNDAVYVVVTSAASATMDCATLPSPYATLPACHNATVTGGCAPGDNLFWQVFGRAPFATVDELATPPGLGLPTRGDTIFNGGSLVKGTTTSPSFN